MDIKLKLLKDIGFSKERKLTKVEVVEYLKSGNHTKK